MNEILEDARQEFKDRQNGKLLSFP